MLISRTSKDRNCNTIAAHLVLSLAPALYYSMETLLLSSNTQ